MFSDSSNAPESDVDSGVASPSRAGSPSAPAAPVDAIPDAGANGALDPSVPAAGAGPEQEQEQELESVLDGEVQADDGAEDEVDVAALTVKAAKADEYLALAQRTQADFENYRKRANREAAAGQERGAIKLARELLPAVDNLERALAHANQSGDAGDEVATLVAGIRHVHTDVLAALRRVGIEAFSPSGEPFDPQYHEAVAQASIDGTDSGTVTEVFQPGYRLGENVLRPARVVVAA